MLSVKLSNHVLDIVCYWICNNLFLQCWLKKQKDVLAPDRQDAGKTVMWTSGLIYGKGEVYKFGEFLNLLIPFLLNATYMF